MNRLAQATVESRRTPARFAVVFDDQFLPLAARLALRVYDAEVAADLAAETLADAFLQRKRFRGRTDGELVGWLNGIANNKLSRFYRRCAIERRALNRLGLDPPSLSEEEHRQVLDRVDRAGVRSALRQELGALSDEQRVALELRVVEERPYAEVAARLGITEEAARARVARALRSLRSGLEKLNLEEQCI